MEPELKCKYCGFTITAIYFFCPNCGKQIKSKPLDTVIAKQIGVYLLSILLPPLGLWPGIKYLKQEDKKSKRIGITAIVLTIAATIVSFWIFFGVMDEVNRQIDMQLRSITF